MGPKLEPAAATSSRNSGTSVRLYHWLLDYHAPALSVWADFEIDYSSAFSFRCVFSCFDLWQTDMKLVSNSMWVFPFFRFSALVGHIQKNREALGSLCWVSLLQVSSTLGRTQSHFCDPEGSLPDWTGSKLGVAYGTGGSLPFPTFSLV